MVDLPEVFLLLVLGLVALALFVRGVQRMVPVLMILVLLTPACGLTEKAREQVITQRSVSDAMVATIEGKAGRVPTYDELVQYVYSLRYGWHAMEYAAGITDEAPDREALAPPGGWPSVADVAPVESGR